MSNIFDKKFLPVDKNYQAIGTQILRKGKVGGNSRRYDLVLPLNKYTKAERIKTKRTALKQFIC